MDPAEKEAMEHGAAIAANKAQIDALVVSDGRQWTAIDNIVCTDGPIDRLRNRLPLWATLALASCTGAISFLAAHYKP